MARTARCARWATFTACCAAGFFEVDARATPADIFGVGPRTQAVGGNGASWDSGSEAAFVNPAALVLTPRSELTLGLHDSVFALDVEGGRAPGRFSTPSASGVLLGVVVPLRVGEEKLSLGLVSRSPADVIAGAHLPYPETPQFALLAGRVQALDLSVALGFAIGARLSLGGGLRALASLGGTVSIAQDPGGPSRAEIEDELKPAYAPSLGAWFDPGEGFAVAVVWRAALRADFDVRIGATDLGAIKLPELNISGVAEYDPAEVHAEVSRQMGAFRLAGSITYRGWSSFPGWLGSTTECPAIRPKCTTLAVDAPALENTWVPRAGVTYGFDLARLAHAEARVGYFYEPSPLSPQTTAANTWDNARHVLTIGYGIDLDTPLFPVRFDAAFQFHALVARTHRKDANVAPTNAGFAAVTTSGNVQSFGLSAGVKF